MRIALIRAALKLILGENVLGCLSTWREQSIQIASILSSEIIMASFLDSLKLLLVEFIIHDIKEIVLLICNNRAS